MAPWTAYVRVRRGAAVNEAQVWASIGLMASMLITMMTVISTCFIRIMRSECAMVRVEIASVDQSMGHRFDTLDRDVQVLYRRAFGGESE